MITIAGSLSKGWLAKKLDVAFDHDYYFNPEKRYEVDRLCNKYAENELADLDIFYTESNLGRFEYFSDNQILVGGIQPNMILGMLIGAEFVTNDSMDAAISPAPLKNKDTDQLPNPQDLLDHKIVGAAFKKPRGHNVVAPRRNADNRHIVFRPLLAQSLGQFKAIHIRHMKVGNDQLDLRMLRHDLQGLATVCGFKNIIPVHPQ